MHQSVHDVGMCGSSIGRRYFRAPPCPPVVKGVSSTRICDLSHATVPQRVRHKFADHVSFGRSGMVSGCAMRAGNRRLPRRGRLSFSCS